MVVVVDLLRAFVLVVLVAALVTGAVDTTVVLVAMFLLGTAEVFVDTTSATLLPMVVPRADLGIGNARMMTATITMNQLIGPSVGAALFALGMAWPFVVQVVCLLLGALLIARMVVPPLPAAEGPRHVGRDIAEGFRWTWHNPAVRTLTLAIVTFNVTYGAAWSVLVVGTLTHLGLALTTTPWVAMTIMFVFGVHRRGPGAGRDHRHDLGRHRAVLVRLRRIRRHPRPHLAGARAHRARRRGRHHRLTRPPRQQAPQALAYTPPGYYLGRV